MTKKLARMESQLEEANVEGKRVISDLNSKLEGHGNKQAEEEKKNAAKLIRAIQLDNA